MALVLKDRVKETTTTTGTGTITLSGAVAGFQGFVAIGDGNSTYYVISDPATGDWEVGIGTYTSSGTTLSRTTVLSSSNAGSAVSFAAGIKDVFVSYPSSRAVYQNEGGTATVQGDFGTINATTANLTAAALTTGTISTTPSGDTDIVNKTYVDTLVASGIHFHQPVRVESPINLTATYDNGTAGVGATLTNSGTQVALVIDGITMVVADRVLVYEQTTQTQNGVYVVTDIGSGSTNWVLTRSDDADTYGFAGPETLSEGSTFFVQEGATGAGETYTCNTTGVITFGTTNITFAQISSAQIYSAGTGLALSGTQFSIANTGTAGTYGDAATVPVITTNAQGQVTGVTPTAIAINGSAVTGNITGSAGSVANALTAGTFLTSGGTFDGSAARTFAVDATSTNTASKVVARDASGNFSAGTITAALSGNATSATNVAGGAANQVIFNTGSGATSFVAAPTTSGQVLGWNGSAFAYTTSIPTANNVTGTVAIANGGTGETTRQAAIDALAGSVTSGQYLRGNGTDVVMSAIQAADVPTLNQNTTGTAGNVTGTVAVANGGTGATTLTANNVILGNGTSAVQTVAPGTSGNVLASNGTTWVSQAAPASTSIAQLDTSVTVADGVTSFTASVASSATTIQASQSGTTLTVDVVNGAATIVVGATISGIGFLPNTVVTAFGTGTGGTGTYTVSTSLGRSSTTANLVYSTMTVTAVTSGTLAVGQRITNAPSSAANSQTIPTNTSIAALGTGSGGTGTYILDKVFTLNSSEVFAGGSVATVVDGQNVQTTAGGNTLIRTTPQFNDLQGAYLSNRLISSYSTRLAGSGTPFYADYNNSGLITVADASSVSSLMISLNQGFGISRVLAYACAYGTNGPNVGLGFSAFSLADVSAIAVGNNPSQSLGAINTVAVGHLTQVGARITFNKYGVDPANSNNVRSNTASYVAAEHQFLGGPVSLGRVTTITTATSAIASTWAYVIFNVAGTATVTLQTQNAVINGRIDDGANTAAGTTFTVTSVTGQAIFVGMEIFVPGLVTEYVTVTAFGTGTGGAGTYTVNTSTRVISTQMISSGPTVGRMLNIKTIQNQSVNSASANVVPLAGGSASTAILAAAAGRWATLVFDGTNWQIMASN